MERAGVPIKPGFGFCASSGVAGGDTKKSAGREPWAERIMKVIDRFLEQ
jgi:hypothetical protein